MKFVPDRTVRQSYFWRLFVTGLEEIVLRRQKFYAILIPGIPISSECEHPSEFPKLQIIEQDEKMVEVLERYNR